VRGGGGGRVAWGLCVLSVGLGVGTIVLALLNGSSLGDFVVDYAALGPVVGIASPVLGALIVTRYPGNRIGWVLCAIGLGLAIVMACAAYAQYSLVTRPGSLPGGAVLGWFYNWGWMPVMGLLAFLFLLFPDGRLRSRRWRPVAWVTAVSLSVPPALVAVISWKYRWDHETWFSDELIRPSAAEFPLVAATESGFFLAATVLTGLGMASVLARLRGVRGVERQQIKWFLYGGGVAVAIFRYRLYEIDRIINRTLVYGLLTGLLGLVYAVGVFAAGRLLDPADGQSELAVAASTLAVAACSSRPGGGSRPRSTGASTAAATTPPRRSRRSAPGCGTRSTCTPSRRSCGR